MPDAFKPLPGAQPRANPTARWLALLIGAALLAVAGAAGRDMWYRWALNDPSNSWISEAFHWAATAPADPLAVTVGVIVALVGVWLLVKALSPRVRTHTRVVSPASIWVRPVDIARKSTHVARQHAPGSAISSRATRKRLNVSVEDDGSAAALQQRVATALEQEFSSLSLRPHIAVTLRPQLQDAGQEGEK
ncbi:hypothetical protein [Corynebacterium lipophiloflavum]|uniref:Alkaline shock response membrane anchor protein AmaP n=1 Tax=Corynebacterium lipophiloflavum (strain ATCC 700352 / DSM 44291 / CCUG 37336 / JCM 10383 / DMMZ 1944) TaxID=525263 RepID=C0XUL3_CORLD|nr:hypothetical protein [Corynebacterium lipophiloflavum]EEI16038.1 hypothetical protein HMPREF0298_2133 [Corynebacterium lipophiloflavum DSM 44291]